VQKVMASRPTDPEVQVLVDRLQFLRRLRAQLAAEFDQEEHALLSLLRERGVPWRELGEHYGVSLNAVAQHYARLEARVNEAGPRGGSQPR
jgi:hypothetical protein